MPTRALLLLLTLTACEPRATEPPKPSVKPTPVAPPLTLPTPPPIQAATPAALIARKLDKGTSVGKVRRGAETRPIQAVGVGQCYDGWALTPLILGDRGRLEPTPPIFVPRRDLPGGAKLGAYTLRHPSERGHLTLTQMDPSRIRATIAMANVTYELDGPRRNLVSGPGLGGRGCFTNGHFRATVEGQEIQGPVTARLEATHFYRIHLMLSEDHALTVLFSQQRQLRAKGEVARVELAEVFKTPGQHKVRAFLETRVDPGEVAADVPALTWEQTPIERGLLTLAFDEAKDEGPITLTLQDVAWPQGFAGAKREGKIARVEAKITPVTDVTGVRVPFAKPPTWWKRK